VLDILHEHNTLNGFWFVLIEFLLVAALTLVFAAMAIMHGSVGWSVASLGVAANAAVVCLSVIGQIRRGERSSSIYRTYLGPERVQIAREHPHLSQHTAVLSILTIVPFALATWVACLSFGSSRLPPS
jgi:hypothetical protein